MQSTASLDLYVDICKKSYLCLAGLLKLRLFQHFCIQGVPLQMRSEVIVNKFDNKKHLGDISLCIAVFS